MLTTVPTNREGTDDGLEYLEIKLPERCLGMGTQGCCSRVFHFAGGTLGGKHTLAINSNSLNPNNPEVF